jgi:hypothetical protein
MTEPVAFAPALPDVATEPDLQAQAISLLLAEAQTAGDMAALSRVARRAGFLWRCPDCREDLYANRDTCRCGQRRP